MAADITALKLQLNITGNDDDGLLARQLAAATAYVEGQLGYALTDTVELPNGSTDDLDQAVLMIAAHWYENREASLVGVSAQSLPFGVTEILDNHRAYTFGAA